MRSTLRGREQQGALAYAEFGRLRAPSSGDLQRARIVRLKNASSGLLQDATSGLERTSWGVSSLARERPRRAALESLKRLVQQHLNSPTLSAEFVCARSGWSRATVYRLFEVEGGLARYIRKRHLLDALRELTTGQPSRLRILDLALAHQFASEASFNRAFRRAFGIPPGKVRDLAASSLAAPRGEPHLRTDRESEATGLLTRRDTGAGTPSVAASQYRACDRHRA